jgi:hypothetical protein
MSEINTAIERLVADVADPQTKPWLRGTVAASLETAGFEKSEVDRALDEYYSVTVH